MRRGAQGVSARGFTLMDVMVAILVMTIGITGLLAMQMTSMSANARSRELMEATQLCQDKIEELRLVPMPVAFTPPNAAGGELVDARGCRIINETRAFCSPLLPGVRYTRNWGSDAIVPNRFWVTVSWVTPDNRTHSTTVSDVR